MNRVVTIMLMFVMLLCGAQAVFAAAGDEVPTHIRNNQYFLESVRLTNLAGEAYEEGDYDASARYSEEAVRFAQLSDEYVRMQLKIWEADTAIAEARARLDYAASVNAASRYPTDYNRAQAAFGEARQARAEEHWDEAVDAAHRVLISLASVVAEPGQQPTPQQPAVVTQPAPAPAPQPGTPPLPAQYTVRPWSVTNDCLWNIAGYPWVYNDAHQWRRLYDANKSGMPDPNNPNLIHPGMILTIPSIKGETRQGMWQQGTTYPPLP